MLDKTAGGGDPARFQHHRSGVIALLALAALTCFSGLTSGPPLGNHESINALAARQALETKSWLIPYLDDAPRIRKPPLGIWLIGAASTVTGHPADAPPVTTFSARLPSAIAGFANVLVIFWLGSMLFGHRTGLIAGVICAGCAATVFYAHNAQVDMVLTFLTSLAFACFWRGAMHPCPSKWAMLAFYVVFALAMMAKAPLPLATVGLALGVFWLMTLPALMASQHGERDPHRWLRRWGWACAGQVRRIPTLMLIPGVMLFLIVAGAWPLYVYLRVDNALDLWRTEYWARLTGELSDKTQSVLYYVPILLALTAPFMASVPEAVLSPFLKRYASRRRELMFAFTWAVVGTCFLSSAGFKRPHYLLSVIPAYCLLLAPVIDRFFYGSARTVGHGLRLLSAGIPILIVVGAVAGGMAVERQFPALLRAYVLAGSAAFLVWIAAWWTYLRGRRHWSFVLLNMGVPILLLGLWPAVSKGVVLNAESKALVAKLREHGISPGADIIWADKRPDYGVEFRTGLHMRRLLDPNEVAALRSNRRTVSADLRLDLTRRLRARLRQSLPAYVIMRAKNYEALLATGAPATRLLFRLEGFREDAEDDLVVFTQDMVARRP